MRGFPSLPRGAETQGTRPALAPSRAASAPYSRARPGRTWGARSCTDVVLPAARSPGSRGIDRPLRPAFHQGKRPGTRRQGLRGGLGSESQRNSPAVLPGGWDSLHVAHPSRLRRKDSDERGRCPTVRVGKHQFFGSPFSTCREEGWGTCTKENIFVCFHGSFQKPLFPHRVVPPSATTLSRNLPPTPIRSLGICSSPGLTARSWPGWNLEGELQSLAPSLRSPLIGSGRKSPFVRYACREGRGC